MLDKVFATKMTEHGSCKKYRLLIQERIVPPLLLSLIFNREYLATYLLYSYTSNEDMREGKRKRVI